jgi:hypothetical protein
MSKTAKAGTLATIPSHGHHRNAAARFTRRRSQNVERVSTTVTTSDAEPSRYGSTSSILPHRPDLG